MSAVINSIVSGISELIHAVPESGANLFGYLDKEIQPSVSSNVPKPSVMSAGIMSGAEKPVGATGPVAPTRFIYAPYQNGTNGATGTTFSYASIVTPRHKSAFNSGAPYMSISGHMQSSSSATVAGQMESGFSVEQAVHSVAKNSGGP